MHFYFLSEIDHLIATAKANATAESSSFNVPSAFNLTFGFECSEAEGLSQSEPSYPSVIAELCCLLDTNVSPSA